MDFNEADLGPDPMGTPARYLYSTSQAAAELGTTRHRVTWLIRQGHLPAVWLGEPKDGHWYVPQDSVMDFMMRPSLKPGPKQSRPKKPSAARKAPR